eukprot:39694-Eustigmatos_ZCMA.PRE.1
MDASQYVDRHVHDVHTRGWMHKRTRVDLTVTDMGRTKSNSDNQTLAATPLCDHVNSSCHDPYDQGAAKPGADTYVG